MKFTWRIRLTLITMATVMGAIVLTWVLNKNLLKSYYVSRQVNTLRNTYSEVMNILSNYNEITDNSQADSGENSTGIIATNSNFGKHTNEYETSSTYNDFLSEEDSLKLKEICIKNNMSLYVVWKLDYAFMVSNGEAFERVINEITPYIISKRVETDYDAARTYYTDKNGEYEVVSTFDQRTKSNYINLISDAVEVDGRLIVIRTNLESMEESVKIANTFLLYAGILVLVLASICMYFASKSVVKPVKQLSTIAKGMADLNFNNKYTGNSEDEIGELGQSINLLSEKLEATISDLKSANNRLQSDVEQKTQIDEMRKEFLSNVTHELKTPIALISGYAEGLKDCINDDAESRDFYCDVIIDEAAKMNTMVKKLLTLNRIEFGNQMLELERFDLCPVLSSVMNSSAVLIKNKNINIMFDAAGPLDVWADEYMIEEVFTNYLTNAINHCDHEMVIDVKAVKTENNSVRVSVFNSGEPIPEEELDKIWIKFYKVDKARTREYGGSGIGLSIVKAIMEAHNMPFGVINHSNGVEFWFELDGSANKA